MDVYVVDAAGALELARIGHVRDGAQLFAPTLLRSQVLAIAHAGLIDGADDTSEALDLAERACHLPRRLLGDAVLRRTAWEIATEQGWAETYDAEYIALTRLHGRALVAGSSTLRASAATMVDVLTVEHFVAG